MASRSDVTSRGDPHLLKRSLDSPKLAESKPVPPPMPRRTSSSSRPSLHDPTPSSPKSKRATTPIKEPKEVEGGPISPGATDTARKGTDSPDPTENSVVDMETFEQILEMDDDENHDFSWSIVLNYFDQAESTIKEMGSALEKEDLASLSRHGHFLKGSSAALGVKKVQESCERMQHYGKLRDEEKGVSITEKDALERIGKLIPQLKVDYAEAEKWLKEHYESY